MHQATRRILGSLTALLLLSGCAHFLDPLDESLTCLHCEVEAARTWHYLRSSYCDVNYLHHFGDGFRAGYVDVCRGGSGCPPTLPPRYYWTWWYRDAAGRTKTFEWFNGFSAGAAAAMQSGYPQYGQLVTAADARGDCDCMHHLEYDLSGPQPDNVERLEPVAPSPDFVGPITPETPTALPPALPLTPTGPTPPSLGANATDRRTTAPFGHSLASPVVRPPLLSPQDVGTLPPTDPAPPRVPPAETVDVPPPHVEDQPFGHSIGQADRGTEQVATEPAPPAPIPIRPLESGAGDSPFSPLGQAALPGNPKPQAERSPDAESPVALPVEVPESEPDDAFPPLEDRFLPRPDQSPPRSSKSGDDTAHLRRPSRSFVEAVTRIRQTSHASQP